MEIFTFYNVAEYLMRYYGALIKGSPQLSMYGEFVCIGIGAALYLIFLVLGGVGLYAMAKRAGVKKKGLAFVPFVNTWYTGKLAGDIYVGRSKAKWWPLATAISEVLYVISGMAFLVFRILLTYSVPAGSSINTTTVPVEMHWMLTASNIFYILDMVFSLIVMVAFVFLYMALFKKYSPRHAFVLTLVSAMFPFRAIPVFVVRNNQPQDFNEYMRRSMEDYYRRNGYPGGMPENMNGGAPENPFEDVAPKKSEPEDPFADLASPKKPEDSDKE